MTTYRSRASLLGDDIVLGSNNNNFTKAEAGKPVLISLDDAETLFHEFGHAIHYLLVDVNYPSLGGSQRDFVEYPSQVNENWLLTPAVLDRASPSITRPASRCRRRWSTRSEGARRSTRASPRSSICRRRWST